MFQMVFFAYFSRYKKKPKKFQKFYFPHKVLDCYNDANTMLDNGMVNSSIRCLDFIYFNEKQLRFFQTAGQ